MRRVSSWLAVVIIAAGSAACVAQSGALHASDSPSPSASHTSAPKTDTAAELTAAENARPGTRAWRLREHGPADAIEGYADRVSVLPGQSFRLFVSTSEKEFRAIAYRMGWYAGQQGREVWRSSATVGHRQAAPTVSERLNAVSAHWTPSLTVSTVGWPEGDYLIKLIPSRGHERYVPITVRSDSTWGKVVLLNSVATWQAYNGWGGYDLYTGPNGSADRSRAVSFDRPYDDSGIGKFLSYERPVVALAERLGFPLAYITDIDLASQPDILRGARALITLGHAEYWSLTMRSAVTEARDAGVNIAFLGANAVNRHVRFDSTELGPNRLVICYKSAAEDPVAGTDPADSTQDWRLPPDPRPESALTGVLYDCFPAEASFVVTRPGNWLFAGTGVKKGTSFPGLVGPESDRLDLGKPTPRPIEVLSDVSLSCGGRWTRSNSVYYTVPSGAGVFNTGTMRWVPALGHSRHVTPEARRFVQQVTTNLLRAFAAGPSGRTRPAQDNAEARASSAG